VLFDRSIHSGDVALIRNIDESATSLDILLICTLISLSIDVALAVCAESESVSLRKVRTRSSFDQILPSSAQVSSGRLKTLRFQLSTTTSIVSVCLDRASAGKARLKSSRASEFCSTERTCERGQSKVARRKQPESLTDSPICHKTAVII